MILHFTNINRRILEIIFFILIGIFFSGEVLPDRKKIFYLPDKSGCIFWKCGSDICNIYLKRKTNNPILLLENSPFPVVEALNRNLVRLFFSCGSPCNYTIFYDSNRGISRAFEFVVAVDIKREIIVIAESNNLVAYKIFDEGKKSLFNVTRDWSPAVTLYNDIIDAKLVGNTLYIKYLEGKDYHEKEEVIHN